MMTTTEKSRLKSMMDEKCPRCRKGEVFKKKGNVWLFQMPDMHEHCPVCHHRFESEPGFFTGAMYASYGLTLIEMIVAYVLCLFLPISGYGLLAAVCTPVVLLWVYNFRKSRMIWMYLF